MPYLLCNDCKIYCFPHQIPIGFRSEHEKKPSDDYKDFLKRFQISNTIIDQVDKYFEDNKEMKYEEQ
jgi:hypothetical protein